MNTKTLSSLVALFVTACVASHPNAPDTGVPPPTPKAAVTNALRFFDSGDAPPTEPLTATSVRHDLNAARPGAPAPQAAAIDALLAALSRADSGDAKTIAPAVDAAAAAWPDDFGLQLQTTLALAHLDRYDEAAAARATKLAARFPAEPLAQSHKAETLAAIATDPLSAMSGYARCLALTPGSRTCGPRLKALAADYVRPRCTGVDASALELHAASSAQDDKTWRKLTVSGQTLYMDPHAALTGADVNEMSDGGDSVHVSLTPAGAARFRALTKTLATSQGRIAIVARGRPVAAPKVMGTIDSGQLQLATGPQVSLGKLCKTLEVRTLPIAIAEAAKRL